MKRTRTLRKTKTSSRRGSTLVIVIAMLGLLAFMGMVFFTFAAQERAASEYFSEAAKAQYQEPEDVWPHMLEQIIVGAPENYRGSILYSPTRRHSMVRNLVGTDIYPHTGDRIEVGYNGAGFPEVTSTPLADPANDPAGVTFLDFVDSPAARAGVMLRNTPAPDVDYTYPDINNLFLAYKGWAVRRNQNGTQTQVPVIIPSFFRPQYMRQAASSAAGSYSLGATRTFGTDTPEVRTNPHWAHAYDAPANPGNPPTASNVTPLNRDTVLFPRRTFRPHPAHVAGVTDTGVVVRRYLTDGEATTLGIAAGGFPFLPKDDNGNGIRGDLGIWTASGDLAYELDVDNDGDGVKDGIWIDLHFPMQEMTDASNNVRKYVVLYSTTIYDLDGLFNVNVHGNLAGLPKTYQTTDALGNTVTENHTLKTAAAAGFISNNYLSRSHHGLGPNEINPLWGLKRSSAIATTAEEHMFLHFGAAPTNPLEQANLEWTWLMMGRGVYDNTKYSVTRDIMTGQITSIGGTLDLTQVIGGRWGDKQFLFNSLEKTAPLLQVVDLPRPGRAGDVYESLTAGNISFGGRNGVDDNQDATEGEVVRNGSEIIRRPFGQPLSWSGKGRRTQVDYPVFNPATGQFSVATAPQVFGAGDPLLPIQMRDTASLGAAQWPGYLQYGAASTMSNTVPVRHTFGPDNTANGSNAAFVVGGKDDLNHQPIFDELFEDPLETIFDQDLADRVRDGIASIGDLIALQWNESPTNQLANSRDPISQHLLQLAPHVFDLGSDNREMFTTYSNTLRYIAMQRSTTRRAWEYSADSDGADPDNNGFPNGDGNLEFPPRFGAVQIFSALDPFRPQVRRLLTNEAGEQRDLVGALPLSINHLLDVDRTDETPANGTPAFLRYMQRSGLRFRALTEHPHVSQTATTASEIVVDAATAITLELPGPSDSDTNTVANEADVAFPPQTVAQQEFWARRDRQQLARDVYVLLYTLGGAEQSGTSIRDYSGTNDPGATVGTVLYTHEQLRRMAQFAVNMVDAMDTDNVITKFEFDKNLGDGWNLDDDPCSAEFPSSAAVTVTGKGMYPEDSIERGIVFGVEAQEIAFSEVLALVSPKITSANHLATLQNDSVSTRHHLFIELQNMLPNTLNLATPASINKDTGIFRIARFDRPVIGAQLALQDQPTAAITLGKDAGTITGGDVFTIATASDANVISSDFFVDYNLDGTYELIAPDVAAGTLPTTGTVISDPLATELKPRCDLDLIHPDHSTSRYTLTDSGQAVVTTAGAFLSTLKKYAGNQPMIDLYTGPRLTGGGFEEPAAMQDGFDLVIQRRLNPHMPSLANTSGQTVDVNPWIEVDRIRVFFTDFGLADGDLAAQIQNHLSSNVVSHERSEPLNDFTRQVFPTPTVDTDFRYNSVGNDFNVTRLTYPAKPRDEDPMSATPNPLVRQQLWQPHFDRSFASAGELLSLPVFGPNLVTQRLEYSRRAPFQQVQGITPSLNNISGSAAMFLWPDFDETTLTSTENDNRWYRLFQFVEVPSRVHRMLGNYLAQSRLPGKINLNMIRHLEVFAGLMDDPALADVDNLRTASPFLSERAAAGGHDRWFEFVQERDGGIVGGYYDPTPALPNSGDETFDFHIPGVPDSQPFRSFGYQDQENPVNDSGINQTILRTLNADRIDPDGGTNRNWLEVGTNAQHKAPPNSSTALERHQILTKIMNNTTTVSNTFIVFATAAYFEAYEDPATGFIRVGGRMDLDAADNQNPGWQQRAVFVIDRTEAFNAFDRGTGDFDWKRLIKAKATIE